MTGLDMENIVSIIAATKLSLKSYMDLYDNVYCISHHRDHAEINLNNYHFVFGKHSENFINAIDELYELKTGLLHDSTTVFHNLYEYILCGKHNEVIVHNLLNIFKNLSWVVTNCYNILDNVDNQFVKIVPGLTEIISEEIDNHYNSNIDFKEISTVELQTKIIDLYQKIYEVYENKFKPNFEYVSENIEKRYGYINSVHNIYKFVLNQIKYLTTVVYKNAQRMDRIINKYVMQIQEYVRPMLTIKYLNCLTLVKTLESLHKCVVEIGLTITDENIKE